MNDLLDIFGDVVRIVTFQYQSPRHQLPRPARTEFDGNRRSEPGSPQTIHPIGRATPRGR
ncbi:hypothetical protein ABID19_003026 [Mesorhizobium robiniae]|uniref:Uncharacterized protein n=1 Tax=Mesorhizobium robiniae TaxID=559315 RepID=A0ABV2GNX4_9HYPH